MLLRAAKFAKLSCPRAALSAARPCAAPRPETLRSHPRRHRKPALAAEGAKLLQQFATDSVKDPGSVRFELLREPNRNNHFTIVEVWQKPASFRKPHLRPAPHQDFPRKNPAVAGQPLRRTPAHPPPINRLKPGCRRAEFQPAPAHLPTEESCPLSAGPGERKLVHPLSPFPAGRANSPVTLIVSAHALRIARDLIRLGKPQELFAVAGSRCQDDTARPSRSNLHSANRFSIRVGAQFHDSVTIQT